MDTEDHLKRWAALLQAARAGDAEAQAELLAALSSFLRQAVPPKAIRMLHGKVSESDLVQESLLEVAVDLPKFDGAIEADFQQWGERILRHNVVDAIRLYRAQRRDVRREEPVGDNVAAIFAPAKMPSSIARGAERQERIDQAIAALPGRYQQVLRLRHECGLAWEAIGSELGTSAEAARKLWARAVKKLQRQLIVGESGIV